jgi:CRISPR-associated exonuclease Cas4
MYDEDELLPLSGLQHVTFCERRFALVHIERQWEENSFTAEGRVLHERAHSAVVESRPGVLIRRTLPLRSFRLGISGQADIVEFTPVPDATLGVRLDKRSGYWQPFPIEYKRRKDGGGSEAYRVQLCAQALCLEEMLGVPVTGGAVFDGTSRRRSGVEFTFELRRTVEMAAGRMHEIFQKRITPDPIFEARCGKCSLQEVCQPQALTRWVSVEQYVSLALKESRRSKDAIR